MKATRMSLGATTLGVAMAGALAAGVAFAQGESGPSGERTYDDRGVPAHPTKVTVDVSPCKGPMGSATRNISVTDGRFTVGQTEYEFSVGPSPLFCPYSGPVALGARPICKAPATAAPTAGTPGSVTDASTPAPFIVYIKFDITMSQGSVSYPDTVEIGTFIILTGGPFPIAIPFGPFEDLTPLDRRKTA